MFSDIEVMKTLYLMKRSWKGWDQCRIGKGILLDNRASTEGADYIWELMQGTDMEMRIQEQILSPKYGIPQTIWRSSKGSMPQPVIDSMWEQHEDNWERGRHLLSALGIAEDKPTWALSQIVRDKRTRSYREWATRCGIYACVSATICQHPFECKGALPVPKFEAGMY